MSSKALRELRRLAGRLGLALGNPTAEVLLARAATAKQFSEGGIGHVVVAT